MFSSCRGFLVVIVHRDGVYSLLQKLSCCNRTPWLVYVLSFRGFLDVILHRDVICSLL